MPVVGSSLGASSLLIAAATGSAPALELFGIRVEFIVFALTLLGVALLHHHTMQVALVGLGVLLAVKIGFSSFDLSGHLRNEAPTLLNLLGLLLGFSLLAAHFEESKIPEALPRYLPPGVAGGALLLFAVLVLSSFLDNIAAAIIGGTMARVVFRGKVHTGYLAAIVAASNAGGAGSVVGDTTTTMMWIDGVAALDVLHAFVGSLSAYAVFGLLAARQQHALQPIAGAGAEPVPVDWGRVAIVALILAGAIVANVLLDFPAAGVWAALLVGALIRKTDWKLLGGAIKSSIFLLSLVFCASLMPVEELPPASWRTALVLGFVSAVFDNIPLTKLALEQGGYDWGVLAYAVGFGGSMIWFGSSAGVALATMYPQARSAFSYVRHGWHVTVAYVVGFAALVLVLGWNAHAPHKKTLHAPAAASASASH